MWKIVQFLLSGPLSQILGIFGKTLTDIRTNENTTGGNLARDYIVAHGAAASTRADVQRSQGTWGPFGIAGFLIALAFAFHVVMIVLDSVPWHLVPVMKFYVLPWLEWKWHQVGSWGVAALPKPFDETEHEILKALFYVGPPSAAIALIAKAFRR